MDCKCQDEVRCAERPRNISKLFSLCEPTCIGAYWGCLWLFAWHRIRRLQSRSIRMELEQNTLLIMHDPGLWATIFHGAMKLWTSPLDFKRRPGEAFLTATPQCLWIWLLLKAPVPREVFELGIVEGQQPDQALRGACKAWQELPRPGQMTLKSNIYKNT